MMILKFYRFKVFNLFLIVGFSLFGLFFKCLSQWWIKTLVLLLAYDVVFGNISLSVRYSYLSNLPDNKAILLPTDFFENVMDFLHSFMTSSKSILDEWSAAIWWTSRLNLHDEEMCGAYYYILWCRKVRLCKEN